MSASCLRIYSQNITPVSAQILKRAVTSWCIILQLDCKNIFNQFLLLNNILYKYIIEKFHYIYNIILYIYFFKVSS